MQELLTYIDDELKDAGPLSLIVAGILVSKDLSDPKYAVKKVKNLNKLAINIALDKEKEVIMHATHTLKRFICDTDLIDNSEGPKGNS